MSYPLGSSLLPHIRVRRERWPGGNDLRAVPLVQAGTFVESDQLVMRLERIPSSGTLPRTSGLALPDRVEPGQAGISFPQERLIKSGLQGEVVGITGRGGVVIEGQVALVAGALGVGRQVAGLLSIWQTPRGQETQPYLPPGSLVVIPGPLNLSMLQRALRVGLGGIIASSISSRDFENFIQYDLIEFLQSAHTEFLLAHLPPLTIMLTEGLGTIAMPVRTIELLNQYQGRVSLLSGTTLLSAQIYPELLMSLTSPEQARIPLALKPETNLIPGSLVRVCSGSYEGAIGFIDYLFTHAQRFPSGACARAVRLKLEDGSHLVAPLAILERIG